MRVRVATGLDLCTGLLMLAVELGADDLERKVEVTLWVAIIWRVAVGVEFVALDTEGSGTSEGRAIKVTCGTKLLMLVLREKLMGQLKGRAVNVGLQPNSRCIWQGVCSGATTD